MKIMMSAGEASGDMHAAAVAAELKRIMPEADIFGMGGADMRKSGVRIIYDIENLGIIGVVEVIRHIPFFFRLRAFLKKAMVEEKPDVLVCVDYPGFNMKLAHVAKELGIPVIYYIAPTIWAWNKGRAKTLCGMWSRWLPYFLLRQRPIGKQGPASLLWAIPWRIR